MVITKLISTEEQVHEANGTIVPNVYKLSLILSIPYSIVGKLNQKKCPRLLQAHVEGSSLRGISRTVNLAYNTVVSLVRTASQKGQMIHNAHLQTGRNLTNQWR